MKKLKNDLYLRALKQLPVERPPVWMMRQAGRFLPEFQELKSKYDFFTRCQTPELATEITLMPIKRFGVDAAILFSDILVIPQAMGVDVKMEPNFGPWIEKPIRNTKDIEKLSEPNVEDALNYVFKAIDLTKKELNQSIPLIGFAGAPWTILCYMIEGHGSKTFTKAKAFCFTQPQAAHLLLQKITNITIAYLLKKIENGCDAIQLFDSWAEVLSPEDYCSLSWPYIEQIAAAISPKAPFTLFAKGMHAMLKTMSENINIQAIGLDWRIEPKHARALTQNKKTLQGNLDPARLLSPISEIEHLTKEMIKSFGTQNYIANLGHGILPNIPIAHAKAFIETVKNFT